MKHQFYVFFQSTSSPNVPLESPIEGFRYIGSKCAILQSNSRYNNVIAQFEDGACWVVSKKDLRPYTKLDEGLK